MTNKTDKTLHNLIEETYNHFETVKKGDKEIVILKESVPYDLRRSVFESHNGRLPDDWIFNIYQSILATLLGYEVKTIKDIDDNRPGIVEGLVDIYTSDLTCWLASHINNISYLDDVIDKNDFDFKGGVSGANLLQRAQYDAIDEIFSHVFSYLENKLNPSHE